METGDEVRDWSAAVEAARRTMENAPRSGRALIEVAAQHPLVDGKTPGVEFTARLDRAVVLRDTLLSNGLNVDMYVPGSRHRADDASDVVSLSSAGRDYLIQAGVPAGQVFGDDLSLQYAPEGVFSSRDECLVTAAHFRQGGHQELHVVLSPEQLARKLLYYVSMGVYPLLHTAPVASAFHGVVYELAEAVPRVLSEGPVGPMIDSRAVEKNRAARDEVWGQYERFGSVTAKRLTEPVEWLSPRGSRLQGRVGDWWVTDETGEGRVVAHEEFSGSYRHVAGDEWERAGVVFARQTTDREVVSTLEGDSVAEPGDWVLRLDGAVWPVPADRFAATYRTAGTAAEHRPQGV